MKIKRGTTREVLLIGKYAVKFASVRSYRLFLRGILGNMQERMFSKNLNVVGMCPVLFSGPLLLFIIMPRCENPGLTRNEAEEIAKKMRDTGIPVESKPCSFGIYKGKIVAVDYGS